jgi:hypothetical protein
MTAIKTAEPKLEKAKFVSPTRKLSMLLVKRKNAILV